MINVYGRIMWLRLWQWSVKRC